MALLQLTKRLKTHLQRQVTIPIWVIYYTGGWLTFFVWMARFSTWIQAVVIFAALALQPFALAAVDRIRQRRKQKHQLSAL